MGNGGFSQKRPQARDMLYSSWESSNSLKSPYGDEDMEKVDTERLAGLIDIKHGEKIRKSSADLEKLSSMRLAELIKINKAARLADSSTGSTTRASQTYPSSDMDSIYTNHELSPQTPTQILTTLFLGSKEDTLKTERLKQLGITHILSVASGHQHFVPGCKHMQVPMNDRGHSCLKAVMESTFKWMDEAQKNGNKLLIHCHLGQNRSPTLVMAWLMKNENLTLWCAHKLVKEARMIVHPHPHYVRQLREYNKELIGVYSTPEDFLTLSFDGDVYVAHEFMTNNESAVYMLSQVSLQPPGMPLLKTSAMENTRLVSSESNRSDLTPLTRERRMRSSRLNIPPIQSCLELKTCTITCIEQENESSESYSGALDDRLPTFVEPIDMTSDKLVPVERYDAKRKGEEQSEEKVYWTI